MNKRREKEVAVPQKDLREEWVAHLFLLFVTVLRLLLSPVLTVHVHLG